DDYAQATGVLPEPILKQMRAGLLSADPAAQAFAATRLDRLKDADPNLIAIIPEDERARAGIIAVFVDLGLPPPRAVELAEKKLAQRVLPTVDHTGGTGSHTLPGNVRVGSEEGISLTGDEDDPSANGDTIMGRDDGDGEAPGKPARPKGPPAGATKPKAPKPGTFKVPAWKNKIVTQDEMDRFMSRHAQAKPNMQNALAEIFAAEGGLKRDKRTGGAFAGIRGPALRDAQKVVPELRGLKPGDAMTAEQAAQAYRAYFDAALHRYGGSGALETIGDPKTAVAFADALFQGGQNGGARNIKEATNRTIRNLDAAQRQRLGVAPLGRKTGPKDTLEMVRRLSNGGLDRKLRDDIADQRLISVDVTDQSLRDRIDHFRF
ncbi:MAG: hypothetical protein O7B26_06240, partial [Planctomycetota bacterium]|nr:hypothetical protein [Planctomycetota bacterium]